jgi:CheY-like chemotaxis protein
LTNAVVVEGTSPLVVPQRILVADDSEVTQDLLKLLLTQRGHSVDVASDGEEALRALKSHDYDVVLMDFHLPGMDGLQVAAAYRSSGSRITQPRFIAITADMKGLLASAENCENFDQIVPKPFQLNEICRVVESERKAGNPDARHPAPLSRSGQKRSPRVKTIRPNCRRPMSAGTSPGPFASLDIASCIARTTFPMAAAVSKARITMRSSCMKLSRLSS